MRTDQLIAALAADAPTGREPRLGARLAIALALGALVSLAAFAATLGMRHDIDAAMGVTAAKLAFAGLAALGGALTLARLARPDATLAGPGVVVLGLSLAVLLGWIAWDLWRFGAEGWSGRMMGRNWRHCLVLVPAFAAAPLAAAIWLLRRAAPAHPAQAGATAGLAAAGLGAAIYALNCNDDSALFVLAWYGLAGLGLVGLGAVLGRLARW